MINMKLSEAAACLKASYLGEDVEFTGCSSNSRELHAGELFIALKGERFDGHDFIQDAEQHGASAALIERQDDVSLPMIHVSDTRYAMGSLAQYWRKNFNIPLVAITGSNGKTTVKEMLASILKLQAPVLATQGNLNNDIGVPLTLFGLGDEHRYAVIEMGANQPGEIERLSRIAQPTVAVITQCAPAHLEGFGSIDGVARAKAEIYENLEPTGIAVVNADDPYADFWREKITDLKQFSFGIEKPADLTASSIRQSNTSSKTDFVMSSSVGSLDISLSLLGRHNVLNALAASACAICLDIEPQFIKQGLENMLTATGRLQFKLGMNNSRIIDDTYNANPASFDAAIKVLSEFQGKRWLVLGDMRELGQEAEQLHRDVGAMAAASGIERLYALGDLSHASIQSFGHGAQHYQVVDELIEKIRAEINQDVTLLIKGSRAMQMERIVNALVGGE